MAHDVFRLAIIGAGGIANAHSAAVKASGGRLSIVAVADVDAANRQKLAESAGAQAFPGVKELLKAIKAGFGVDGAVVCTPPFARVDIVTALLKAGIPVLSEKPIAHTAADAKKLASLAKKHKKVFTAVGYCHRFAPAVNRMKALVSGGKIGSLVRFENVFACDLPGHGQKWFSDPKKAGGGAYIDMGSHSVDLLHYVVGPAKTVGAIFHHKWKGRSESEATVLLKSLKPGPTANIPAGVGALIESGWAETSRFTVTLVGDQGMLFYDYEKPAELIFKDLVGKVEVMPVEEHGVRFQRQLEAFADAVQKKAKTNLASFADGLAANLAVAAAQKLAAKK